MPKIYTEVIWYCIDCKWYDHGSGWCDHECRSFEDGFSGEDFGVFPDWCPLRDASEATDRDMKDMERDPAWGDGE